MAEGRILKKNVSTSKKLSSLKSDSARLLWTWLLAHLDVAGRFSGEPDVVKGSVVPRLKHLTEKRVEELLEELDEARLINLYTIGGERYLELCRFEDFQNLRVDREGESKIPQPPENKEGEESSRITPGVVPASSSPRARKDKDKDRDKDEDKDKPELSGIDDKFNEFWTAYPQAGRHAKKESRVKFGALVKRGELLEFIKGFHGYLDYLKHQKINKDFDQTPLYAKTFLGDRWREFVGFEFKSG